MDGWIDTQIDRTIDGKTDGSIFDGLVDRWIERTVFGPFLVSKFHGDRFPAGLGRVPPHGRRAVRSQQRLPVARHGPAAAAGGRMKLEIGLRSATNFVVRRM